MKRSLTLSELVNFSHWTTMEIFGKIQVPNFNAEILYNNLSSLDIMSLYCLYIRLKPINFGGHTHWHRYIVSHWLFGRQWPIGNNPTYQRTLIPNTQQCIMRNKKICGPYINEESSCCSIHDSHLPKSSKISDRSKSV